MLHTFSIVTFPPQNFVSMRANYTASIWKLYGKVKLLLYYKMPFGIWFFYFVLFLPYKTQTQMIHAKKLFPTQNYCTLSSPTEPPSLPTTLLCPGWPICPWELSGKKDFFDLSLQILNVMFLNYLIHPFVFLVPQHPKGLSFDLLSCISTNIQNVKHLAAAK